MPGLADQFKGVNSDSLAELGNENDPQDEVIDEEVEPEEVVETETEETDEESDEPKGRTIDNVYGELSRKQEKTDENQQKFQETMMTQMGNLVREVTDKLGAQPAGQQGPKTVEDYSIAELTAYRDNLPAEDPQRPQIDALVADKIVNDKVDQRVQAVTKQDRLQAQREQVALETMERYPELRNENSSFYQDVDARIRSLSSGYVADNPRVAMDVANEIAIAKGISPTQPRNVIRVPGTPSATKRHGSPVPTTKVVLKMSEAEAGKIAKRLEGAMGRKFTKEEIQNIRENHKDYDDNRGLFTR